MARRAARAVILASIRHRLILIDRLRRLRGGGEARAWAAAATAAAIVVWSEQLSQSIGQRSCRHAEVLCGSRDPLAHVLQNFLHLAVLVDEPRVLLISVHEELDTILLPCRLFARPAASLTHDDVPNRIAKQSGVWSAAGAEPAGSTTGRAV